MTTSVRNASDLVESATRTLGIRLADLIALASVWISPEVYEIVRPAGGTWFPDRRRANLGLRVDGKPVEAVGQVIDGVTLDSNNYANVAFKAAIGVDRRDFVGFHICHIWPGTGGAGRPIREGAARFARTRQSRGTGGERCSHARRRSRV